MKPNNPIYRIESFNRNIHFSLYLKGSQTKIIISIQWNFDNSLTKLKYRLFSLSVIQSSSFHIDCWAIFAWQNRAIISSRIIASININYAHDTFNFHCAPSDMKLFFLFYNFFDTCWQFIFEFNSAIIIRNKHWLGLIEIKILCTPHKIT